MVSLVDTNFVGSNIYVELCDHDPGGTTAILLSADGGTTKKYLDMRNFLHAAFKWGLTIPASGSGITKVELVAASDVAFTSPVVVKDTGTIDADAVMDQGLLECSAEELMKLGQDLRYVTLRITCSNAGDEAVVAMIGMKPRFAVDELTPALSIA